MSEFRESPEHLNHFEIDPPIEPRLEPQTEPPRIEPQPDPHAEPLLAEPHKSNFVRFGAPIVGAALVVSCLGSSGGYGGGGSGGGGGSSSAKGTKNCTPATRKAARADIRGELESSGFKVTPRGAIALDSCAQNKKTGVVVSFNQTRSIEVKIGGTSCLASVKFRKESGKEAAWRAIGFGIGQADDDFSSLFDDLKNPTGDDVLKAARKDTLGRLTVKKCAHEG